MHGNKAMTVHDWYTKVLHILEAQGDISMPELEARELVSCALGEDVRRIPQAGMVSASEQAALEQLLERRLQGEPLAYLLEEWDFYGITLRVTPDVLIPRSDTERLCELAIEQARICEHPHVLDLCSGSGCIALALLHEVPKAHAVGVDLSPDAIALARHNAERLGLSDRYTCIRGNAREAPPQELISAFDIMVCNPPYITEQEMRELDHSVVDYEPHLALYGGTDGLDFYRAIVQEWAQVLRPDGVLFFECGWEQGEDVAKICMEAGLRETQIETDYAGVPRIVHAQCPR